MKKSEQVLNRWVALFPNGQYVREGTQSTHVGYRATSNETPHLDEATLYDRPRFNASFHRVGTGDPPDGCTFWPVKYTRIIERVPG